MVCKKSLINHLVDLQSTAEILIFKQNRSNADAEQLMELKKAVDKQIEAVEKQKAKQWALYR